MQFVMLPLCHLNECRFKKGMPGLSFQDCITETRACCHTSAAGPVTVTHMVCKNYAIQLSPA